MKIGMFDSGLGGLTILRETVKALPQYDYYYYGDTKNLPYGNKTETEIYEYTKRGVEHLFAHDCLLVIIACNTASAETLRRLQDKFLPITYPDRRILGVIIPTIETLKDLHSTKALLIATKRTVESKKYEKEIQLKCDNSIVLSTAATPTLVDLIESNKIDEALKIAQDEIETWRGKGDTIILGCTHYTLLKDQLRALYSNEFNFVSQDEVIPKKLKQYLEHHPELESRLTPGGDRHIHLTEHRPDYDLLMVNFLQGR